MNHKHRRAFTLIEMVVSLSIISIVFLAMGSVMVLASKAVPDPKASTNLALDAADLLEQMAAELQIATSVTVATDKGISFTVPDRDGDGADESIVYLWGGVAGSALVRKYNGGAVTTVASNVYEFTLTYDTVMVPQPDALVESAETVLISYNSALLLSNAQVRHDEWWGQYFKPSLPNDAVAWSVTRVKYMAKEDNDTAPMTIKLCLPTPDNSKPSSTVIDSTILPAGALTGNYRWVESSFMNAKSISPATGAYLTFSSDLYRPARLQYQSTLVTNSRVALAEGGPPWNWNSAAQSQSLLFYVYGTYSTLDPQPALPAMRSVQIRLNTGSSPASRVRNAAVTLNKPLMP